MRTWTIAAALALAGCGASGGGPAGAGGSGGSGGGGGDGGGGGAIGTGCDQPLDEATLAQLVISSNTLGAGVQLRPGESFGFQLGLDECCYVFRPVESCVRWSVVPAEGATIDPATGALRIDEEAPPGSVFTVRADVESGRRVLTESVRVYTAQTEPLVGLWREEVYFGCDEGGEAAVAMPIEELVFLADGSFRVTWTPFERYVDYWGRWEASLDEGWLRLHVTGGNWVPSDLDLEGSFDFDAAGRLVLKDLWLGSYPNTVYPHGKGCGYRFER